MRDLICVTGQNALNDDRWAPWFNVIEADVELLDSKAVGQSTGITGLLDAETFQLSLIILSKDWLKRVNST